MLATSNQPNTCLSENGSERSTTLGWETAYRRKAVGVGRSVSILKLAHVGSVEQYPQSVTILTETRPITKPGILLSSVGAAIWNRMAA